MENKKFYIKYLTNQPIKVETHHIGEQDRRRPLTDVGDLIGAFQARPGSLLANTDSGLITLHLPEGVAKDSLEQDRFANADETDTTLRPSLVLSRLNGLGSDDLNPLVIKSTNVLEVQPPAISKQSTSSEREIGSSSFSIAAVKRPLVSDEDDTNQVKKLREVISEKLVATAGADFVYSDRGDSFKVLADCLEKRHLYWKQGKRDRKTDRNLHPIPFLADGPGSGKSRFLQELQSSFIKFVPQGTYSQDFKDIFKSPVCINITFSNGSLYSLKEAEAIKIEHSVCLRILYQFETEFSNFGSFYDSFKSQEFSLSNILQNFGMNASCIILGIDEVNKVYEIGKELKEIHHDEKLRQLKLLGLENDVGRIKELNDIKERLLSGLFGLIGGLSCEFTPFFIPVLAGTVIGPIKSVVRESTHPPLHIPLPLLSFESCLNIFAKKDSFPKPVLKSRQLRQLITDCGGHCRSLEILYNCFLEAYVEDISLINWKVVFDQVCFVLHQRYALSTIPLATAIARSLLGLDTEELDFYDEMEFTTYQDLEERGLLKLQNRKVKISHLFVCCFLSQSKYKTAITKLWTSLLIEKDFWWQDWEVFNWNYISFRLSLFAYLGETSVSLKKFFAGAKLNIPVNIYIKIPSLPTLKVSKIDYRYPSTQAPTFDIGNNVLNANGALFDSFLYLDTTTNLLDTTTNQLLFAFQMKLAKQDSTIPQVICDDTVNVEFNKINNAVSKYLKGKDFVCVILGRCRGTFSEDNLPSKCVVVSKEEQMNFYGESYYHRLNDGV
jgi:hypothetical protein